MRWIMHQTRKSFLSDELESYQQAKKDGQNQRALLIKGNIKYSSWSDWYRSKKELKKESKRKIRLSTNIQVYYIY